jgi:hypothetical protein
VEGRLCPAEIAGLGASSRQLTQVRASRDLRDVAACAIEGKTMLATLPASSRFELPEAELPEPLVRITLRPRSGLKLKVTMLR